MFLDKKEQELLKGTVCVTCELCSAPQPTLKARADEVVCLDGITRRVVKNGRTCTSRTQVQLAANATFPLAAFRS